MKVDSLLTHYAYASMATMVCNGLVGILNGISTCHTYNNISSRVTHICKHCVKGVYEAAIVCICAPFLSPIGVVLLLYTE